MRLPSTRTHFEWLPGMQATPPCPNSANAPMIWVSSPRITSGTPAASSAVTPGTSRTSAMSKGTGTVAPARSAAPAGQGR